jgi:SAM-dependent methyltransferase
MSQEIRTKVQKFYAERARDSSPCCEPDCCGDYNTNLLYESDLLTDIPTDVANFTLGCGDPITIAEIKPGETVLDLGSGGGLDCFLAARQVGESGTVIGVDMTPEMLSRARTAAERMGFKNVKFRQGYLEDMPVEDNSIDVVISNCVINLSADKPKVFSEMYRTLKPGGRVSVSDIVTNGELPEKIKNDMDAWGACIAGALEMSEYEEGLRNAGFIDVKISAKNEAGDLLKDIPPSTLFSAAITACKE